MVFTNEYINKIYLCTFPQNLSSYGFYQSSLTVVSTIFDDLVSFMNFCGCFSFLFITNIWNSTIEFLLFLAPQILWLFLWHRTPWPLISFAGIVPFYRLLPPGWIQDSRSLLSLIHIPPYSLTFILKLVFHVSKQNIEMTIWVKD